MRDYDVQCYQCRRLMGVSHAHRYGGKPFCSEYCISQYNAEPREYQMAYTQCRKGATPTKETVMNRYQKLRKALKQDIRPEHHDYAELSAVWYGIHTVLADVAREMLKDEHLCREWHNFYETTLDRIVYEAMASINRMATGPVGTRNMT